MWRAGFSGPYAGGRQSVAPYVWRDLGGRGWGSVERYNGRWGEAVSAM